MNILGVLRVEKKYVEKAFNIILRVPALFILEANEKSISGMSPRDIGDIVWMTTMVAYYSVGLFAIVLATIPLKHLVTLYMYLISLGSVAVAYYLSNMYIKEEINCSAGSYNTGFANCRDYGVLNKTFVYFFVQCIIATVISCLMDIRDWTKYTLLIFILPICTRLLGIPVRDLHIVQNVSTLFITIMVVLYTLSRLPESFRIIRDSIYIYLRETNVHGSITVIVNYWHAVVLPVQLLLFWICLFMSQLYVYYHIIDIVKPNGIIIMLLLAMSECCSTPTSLFAMCITISYLSYYVLTTTKVFLLGWQGLVQDYVRSHGSTEGFIVLIFAFQAGLLQISVIQRAFLMRNLLFIAIFTLAESVCEMTDTILVELSVGHRRSLCGHLRVLSLCILLCALPLHLAYQIYHYYDFDILLIMVLSSCILMTVQVIGSLLVYWLFWYDTLRTETWERLDDVVYYIRSTVRIFQFISTAFSVCFGIYESIYVHWNWRTSGFLIICCYFNVWQRLQSGWKTFLVRREAVHRIESLPEASPEQLLQHNDVCAICYQEMNSSKITPCGHYFHGYCLRKWLYVRDVCPLCHHAINVNLSSASTNNGNMDASNIDVNSSNIDENTSDIDVNTSVIDVNASDIDVNTSDIDENTSNVDVNTSDIDVNTSDIDANTSNIDVNTSNIKDIIDLVEPDENCIETEDQGHLKEGSKTETPTDIY